MLKDVGLVSNVWRSGTISKILANEVYLGNMVQGKTKVFNHRQRRVPPDDWTHVEHTHQSIISKELFDAAQRMRRKTNCSDEGKPHDIYSPNLFKGKIYCAHCGGRMERKQNHNRYEYRCTAHYATSEKGCATSIQEDALIIIMSDAFIRYSEELPESSQVSSDKKAVHSELARLRIDISAYENTVRELYENRIDGSISKQEYDKLWTETQDARALSMQRIAELTRQQTELKIAEAEWLELKNSLEGFKESWLLTRELIEKWVVRIGIAADERVYIEFVTFYCHR